MSEPKIIAWAAVARGAAVSGATFHFILSGSTKSETSARKEAEAEFVKHFPGVPLIGTVCLPIREGDGT